MVYIRGRPLRSSKLQRNAEDFKMFFEKSATSCSDEKKAVWSVCTKKLNFKKVLYLHLCTKCQILTAVCSQFFWKNGIVLMILLSPVPEEFCIANFRNLNVYIIFFRTFWGHVTIELLNKGLRLL